MSKRPDGADRLILGSKQQSSLEDQSSCTLFNKSEPKIGDTNSASGQMWNIVTTFAQVKRQNKCSHSENECHYFTSDRSYSRQGLQFRNCVWAGKGSFCTNVKIFLKIRHKRG